MGSCNGEYAVQVQLLYTGWKILNEVRVHVFHNLSDLKMSDNSSLKLSVVRLQIECT